MRRLLLGLVLAALVGCGSSEEKAVDPPAAIAMPQVPIEFEFPAGWSTNPKETPFDLQVLAPDQTLNTGIFYFTKAQTTKLGGPQKVLEAQVADIRGKREDFRLLEPPGQISLPDKTIVDSVYSGERDGAEYLYRFALIEFADDDRYVLVTLQVALPERWSQDKPILDAITRSARLRSSTPTPTPA